MRFYLLLTLILVCTVLAVTLLIGQRFGFTWAGGDGYQPSIDIVIEETGELIRRGETISTATSERLKASVSNVQLALDENTDLEIIRTNNEELELFLHRGRLHLDSTAASDLTIKVRSKMVRTELLERGQVSFVYYDFRDTLSIIPFNNTEVEFSVNEKDRVTSNPIDVLEIEPYTLEYFDFAIPGSAAEEFYLEFMD